MKTRGAPREGASAARTALTGYLSHLAHERRLSAHTVASYGRDIEAFLACAGTTPLADINTHDIRRYAARQHAAGLGPKPGVGHLWIRAELEGGDVRLTVEDDGEGLRASREPHGVGLANIADRLRTLYRDRASVTLAPRDGGGARATVRIPGDAA